MKIFFALALSLAASSASAQTFPEVKVSCVNQGQPVKLALGVYQNMIAESVKLDSERSLVFTTSPLPNHGQDLGSQYTFRLVVGGKTTIATSEIFGLPELQTGGRLKLNFTLADEANGIDLRCQAFSKR